MDSTITFFTENQIMFWLIIATTLLVLLGIIHFFKNKIIIYFRKKTHANHKELDRLEAPIILVGIIIAFQIILTKLLGNYTTISQDVLNLTKTLIIIFVTYALSILMSIILEGWNKRISRGRKDTAHEEILTLTKSITNIILSVAAIFLILTIWGIEIGGLLASLGIAGIILSFAFQDTLKNIFGGISLILDESFRKGDLIELPNGEVGFVMEINLRSTKIKNFDLQEILIPNGQLANMNIKNYAHPTKCLRIKIPVSIAYGSDIKKFKKIVMQTITEQDNILKYPKPKIFFDKMGEFSLDFNIAFFVKNYIEMYKVKSEMVEFLYENITKSGIKIPFPSRTIYKGD